jgi:hypothetical protein
MEVLRNIGNIPVQLYPTGDICLQILAIETMIFFREDQTEMKKKKEGGKVHLLQVKEPNEHEVMSTIPRRLHVNTR